MRHKQLFEPQAVAKVAFAPSPLNVVDRPYLRPSQRILSFTSGRESLQTIRCADGSTETTVSLLADPRTDIFDISEYVAKNRAQLKQYADLGKPLSGRDLDAIAEAASNPQIDNNDETAGQ